MYNPTIISKCITKDEIIEIPKGIEKYSVHFFIEAGEVKIYYGSLENKPPLFLYNGAKWNKRFFNSGVNKLIIQGLAEFKLWCILEHIQ
jgi:hypothetical protein